MRNEQKVWKRTKRQGKLRYGKARRLLKRRVTRWRRLKKTRKEKEPRGEERNRKKRRNTGSTVEGNAKRTKGS